MPRYASLFDGRCNSSQCGQTAANQVTAANVAVIRTEAIFRFLFNQHKSDCVYHFPIDMDPKGVSIFVPNQEQIGCVQFKFG